MKKLPKVLLPIIVIAVAISGFLYLKSTRPQATPKPVTEKVWPVSVVEAQLTDVQPPITEFGTVVAGSVVELRPLVDGRIVKLGQNFVEGATVKQGETLVVIDPFDYEVEVVDKKAAIAEAEARLKETRSDLRAQRQMLRIARSQVRLRKTDLDRKKKLSARGSLSQKSRDDASIAYNDAQQSVQNQSQLSERLDAKLDQLTAALARSRAALSQAERNLSETMLIAPEDGYLASAVAAVGQRVGSSDRLARLIVTKRLEVSFQLSRRDFGRLAGTTGPEASPLLVGRKIKVDWRVGRQSFRFDATIARLGAEIDAASGGIGVYARLDAPNLQTPLRPGAFVEVNVPGNLYRKVYQLPESALGADGTVYIIQKGRLTPLKVNVLRRVAKDVLVRADIPTGSKIVTTHFPEIGPGLRVEVR
ncbi:MAG: efflux RND transporter periplasmic adaptor subunit [Alphaproteobacteria bacterium]|nr:efflux RND transporter periplasmic adaptor subunit [Alphaproteobacteria bacterium]